MVNAAVWWLQNVDIGRDHQEKQRVSEALARVDAQREKLSSQLGELEATERVLARYSKVTPANRTASAKTPTAATKVTAAARSRGRLHTTTATGGKRTLSTRRSGPCLGNRQDTAGNRCGMQRRSPKPCRRGHCPTQTGRPHRRARGEALRHAVGASGATRRGLTAEQNGRE